MDTMPASLPTDRQVYRYVSTRGGGVSDCVKTQLNVDMHWNASIHNNIGICLSLPYDRGSIHALSVLLL